MTHPIARLPIGAWILVAAVAAATFSASLALALAIGWTLGVLTLACVRFIAQRRGDGSTDRPTRGGERPFVSIHEPCCDEPPDVVCRTLDALSRLRWTDYEVIVLDNNTPSHETWQPVAEHCARLGTRFVFRHVDHLEGAKAAALNLCLEMADPRTEAVMTVDADYAVQPDALAALCGALDPGVSHVQAPQAYDPVEGVEALEAAYASYFERFATGAGRDAMLLTGTLSLIRVVALREVGGWSSATITEDADLGLRLLAGGWRGVYLPRVLGRGRMPDRMTELRKQRRRWVHGNAQVLFGALGTVRRLPRRARASALAQLTAWFQPWALPAAAMALFMGAEHRAARWILALSVVVYALSETWLFWRAPRRLAAEHHRGASLAAHLALGWEGAVAWLEVLAGVRLGFRRTSKRPGRGRGSLALRATTGAVAVALAAVHGARGEPLVATACLILASLPLASHHLALALERAAPETATLQRTTAERT